MTAVELSPADIYNQKTISQGHPPGWTNGAGGDFDLVVLGGGPAGLVSVLTAAASGRHVALTEQRLTGGPASTSAARRARRSFVARAPCMRRAAVPSSDFASTARRAWTSAR